MNIPVTRKSYKEGFWPSKPQETFDVPFALDNLVCAACNQILGTSGWCAVSSPKHKGIIVFACEGCVGNAMNMLGEWIGNIKRVPPDLKLPNEGTN